MCTFDNSWPSDVAIPPKRFLIPGLDRSVCKLFVLDRNTWYHMTVYKKLHKNSKYKTHTIPKILGIK